MPTEPFRPSRHGFAFTNTFSGGLAEAGLGTPVHPSFGLGAGMVWASLDRYLSGRPMEAALTPPEPGAPLYLELADRHASALAAVQWSRVAAWQSMPDQPVSTRSGLAGRTRAEWRRLRTQLDRGLPVMLFLVIARGRHANPSLNRAVLAVGYEREPGTKRIALRVYDPDRPKNDGVRLVFTESGRAPLEARLAVHTEVRGFFAVPYDRPLPAHLELGSADLSGCDVRQVLAVHGDRPGPDGMQVLGRNREGAVVRIRRTRAGKWTVESLDGGRRGKAQESSEDGGAVQCSADRVFTRAADGSVLEHHRMVGVGWRSRNLTSRRGIGDAFRITGPPAAVVGRRTGTSVVGCARGSLVRYHRSGMGGWQAEELGFGPTRQMKFSGTPAVVEDARGTLHVLARSEAGDLVHLRLVPKTGWVAESVTSRTGARDRFSLVDDPVVLHGPRSDRIDVAGRAAAGDLLLFRWTDARGWRGIDLSAQTRSAGGAVPPVDSAVAADLDADGTVHVVGRDAHGGLVHAWCTDDGATGGEGVTFSRPRIGDGGRVEGSPQIVAGPGPLLHVLARQGDEVLLYRWAPVADWSIENLTREQRARTRANIAGDVVMSAGPNGARAAFVQSDGRVHWAVLENEMGGDAASAWTLPAGRVLGAPVAIVAAVVGTAMDAVGAVIGSLRARSARASVGQPQFADEDVAAPAFAAPSLPVMDGARRGAAATDEPRHPAPDPAAVGSLDGGTADGLVDWTPADMFGPSGDPDPWAAVQPASGASRDVTSDTAATGTPAVLDTDSWELPVESPAIDVASFAGTGDASAAVTPSDLDADAAIDAPVSPASSEAEAAAAPATSPDDPADTPAVPGPSPEDPPADVLVPAEESIDDTRAAAAAADAAPDPAASDEPAAAPVTAEPAIEAAAGTDVSVVSSPVAEPELVAQHDDGAESMATDAAAVDAADPVFPFEEDLPADTPPAPPATAPAPVSGGFADLTLLPSEEPATDPWSDDPWGAPAVEPAMNGSSEPLAAAAPDTAAGPPRARSDAAGSGKAPPAAPYTAPKRRVNPALEGLPLLTEEDGEALDGAPTDRRTPKPHPTPPSRPAQAKPGAVRPKPRRLLGMEQVMALADANAPQVLPPDGKP